MIALEQINSLKEYFQSAETIAVILGAKPSVDQIALASALFEGCKNLNKEVGFYAPRKIQDEYFSSLNELQTELGKQNLVVSFDYDETAVDKVSYHIGEDTKKFYLTVKPKRGQKPLDAKSVEFSYAGAEFDLVFLIGVHDLDSLEQLYYGYESFYDNTYVVTLHNFKTEIGTAQLDLSGFSSLCEGSMALLENIGIELTESVATPLLMGLDAATQNLQSFTATADTFDNVAKLLRTGARRIKRKESPSISIKEDKKLGRPRKKRITKIEISKS
ncbi:MAG: hypothetical protein COU63_03560 [Candidatus Pacebacteria bacterium CG10_big_fil_rev_8_21_14_0_10_36_11]|nr:hypothetical protein [Candidatus Pacearchaeota archaeon]OIP73898.1 MAG: hypothetical protein AUK08_05070 [Candidatus Pacebacteria bacterium CG2_30_36_39]PIR64540.1 MAG: hypothetical protein COU63_03560 [Candidatus Pacebacteria bacterium CG10_big_fil_rev_8_21_14_0_10_36_11]PJC43277.1 MAG: hypothetical protein CO040_00025 [Candidatus Pacebacteria bacterium CG_4_9_14_0_2_um_filter_36_8]